MSSTPYMLIFGVTELVFSQIPDFDQVWWLSIVAAVMSFTYSTIGLALGIVQVIGKILRRQASLVLSLADHLHKLCIHLAPFRSLQTANGGIKGSLCLLYTSDAADDYSV